MLLCGSQGGQTIKTDEDADDDDDEYDEDGDGDDECDDDEEEQDSWIHQSVCDTLCVMNKGPPMLLAIYTVYYTGWLSSVAALDKSFPLSRGIVRLLASPRVFPEGLSRSL